MGGRNWPIRRVNGSEWRIADWLKKPLSLRLFRPDFLGRNWHSLDLRPVTDERQSTNAEYSKVRMIVVDCYHNYFMHAPLASSIPTY